MRKSLSYLFSYLFFLGAGLIYLHFLPAFEGMDEVAHFSRVLDERFGDADLAPRIRDGVEEAFCLGPAPADSLHGALGERCKLTSYASWRELSADEKIQRLERRASLNANQIGAAQTENWQYQHPRLYYFLIGQPLRLLHSAGVMEYFFWARILSAAIFALLAPITFYFIQRRGLGMLALALVLLQPMWCTMGFRIANDALALPALALALFILLEECLWLAPQKKISYPSLILFALSATLALAAKAYSLILLPLTSILIIAFLYRRFWSKALSFFLAILAPLLLTAPVYLQNLRSGRGLSGQNEAWLLREKGIVSFADKLPYLKVLLGVDLPDFAKLLFKALCQFLFVSNWSLGAAFPVFYPAALFIFILGLVSLFRLWRQSSVSTVGLILLFTAVAGVIVGILRSMLDYYILWGEAQSAAGWYLWCIGAPLLGALIVATLRTLPKWGRGLLFLQATCFLVAMASNAAFWSGKYLRHPLFRYPVKTQP